MTCKFQVSKHLSFHFDFRLTFHFMEFSIVHYFCLRPKAKDLGITWVVVLVGFFIWSMPYQLPPPCYPQNFIFLPLYFIIIISLFFIYCFIFIIFYNCLPTYQCTYLPIYLPTHVPTYFNLLSYLYLPISTYLSLPS